MKFAKGRSNVVQIESDFYEVVKETNKETGEARTFVIEYTSFSEMASSRDVRLLEMQSMDYAVIFSRYQQ